MRAACTALLLAACGGSAARPADAPLAVDAPPPDVRVPDAPSPDACGPAFEPCSTSGVTCTNAQGRVCQCPAFSSGWICNPPACPDMSNGPATGPCTQPGLSCSTGEFSEICVAPEDVWVMCTPFECEYGEPKDGAVCCPFPYDGSDHCVVGCTVCDCKDDDHWHCAAASCPDAG
jgi:hypothetical protein